MEDKKPTELKQISIDDMPAPTRSGTAWPYDQWEEEILPGNAIEITDQLGNQKASSASSTIKMHTRRRGLKIQSLVRNNRIWIYKDKEAEVIE